MGKSSNSTLEDKARRYLAEHRVTILTHTPNTITTRTDSPNGRYYTEGDRHGYTCTCPAGTNGRTCSHIIATELLAHTF